MKNITTLIIMFFLPLVGKTQAFVNAMPTIDTVRLEGGVVSISKGVMFSHLTAVAIPTTTFTIPRPSEASHGKVVLVFETKSHKSFIGYGACWVMGQIVYRAQDIHYGELSYSKNGQLFFRSEPVTAILVKKPPPR